MVIQVICIYNSGKGSNNFENQPVMFEWQQMIQREKHVLHYRISIYIIGMNTLHIMHVTYRET